MMSAAAASSVAQQQQQQPQIQQQQQPSYVLVRNGALVPCSQSAAAWLQGAPRGAYTTARTVGPDAARVLKLGSHIARLAASANLMLDADETLVTSRTTAPRFSADALRPGVVACIAAAMAAMRARQSGSEPEQLKLTLLMTWQDGSNGGSSGEQHPLEHDLWCHAEPLPPRPRPPVKLAFRGLPRANAAAKDSEWVRQRRALEDAKPPDANEVVLVAPGGCAMEGLSSNFFALHDGALVTAGAGVLGGTIRELVLDAARGLGLEVRLEPPRLDEADRWQGAAVSSTSRLFLPANEMRWGRPGGGGGGGDGAAAVLDAVRTFDANEPTLRALEDAVAARLIDESELVPLPPPAAGGGL
jgi:thiol oxidase